MDPTTINVIATCVLLILVVAGVMAAISYVRSRHARQQIGNKAIKVPLNEDSPRFDSSSAGFEPTSAVQEASADLDLKLAKSEIFGRLFEDTKPTVVATSSAGQFATVKGIDSDFSIKPQSADSVEEETETEEIVLAEEEVEEAVTAESEAPVEAEAGETEVESSDADLAEAAEQEETVSAEEETAVEDEADTFEEEDAEAIARELVAEVLGECPDFEDVPELKEVEAEVEDHDSADHNEEIEVHEEMPAYAARAVESLPSIPLFTMAPPSISEAESVEEEPVEEAVSDEQPAEETEAEEQIAADDTSEEVEAEETPEIELKASVAPDSDAYNFDEVPVPQEKDVLSESVSNQISQLDSDLNEIETLVAAIEASLADFRPLDGMDLESEFEDDDEDYSQAAA